MDQIKKDVEEFLKIFTELLPIKITETDTKYNIEFKNQSILDSGPDSDKWEVEIDKEKSKEMLQEMLKEIYKLYLKNKKYKK